MTSSHDRPTVLVTGASRGVGAVIARRLADEGSTVFAGARRPAPTDHPHIVPVSLDVTDPVSIARAAAEVAFRCGDRGLAGLVNNAAVLDAGPLELVTPEQLDRQLRTNVAGPVLVTQGFLPLIRAGRGRIVNVSSVNAQLPMPYWGVYSASKAALVALSDVARMELAPWGIGVTVLTLGALATDIRRRAHGAWVAGDHGERYAAARATAGQLVDVLDATADPVELAADAVLDVLRAGEPPASRSVGTGVDDLLELATQPADVREAVLNQLLGGA